MMRTILGLCLTLAGATTARAFDGALESKATSTDWTVTYNGQRICVYTFAPDQFKPYVRELAPLSGSNILRDSPFDHKHHHALMYAIRVDGVNFWEESPAAGIEKPVVGRSRTSSFNTNDGPATTTFVHQVLWLDPADAARADAAEHALLIEERTLTLTIDEAASEVALRWRGDFQVGPRKNEVTLTGSNYNGLGMRFLQELDPSAQLITAGEAPDLADGKQAATPGTYGAVLFPEPPGPATIALFGSPKNAGGNVFFAMKQPFAYLSATQGLDKSPLVYKAGDSFTVDHLVTVYPEVKTTEFLDRRAAVWAESLGKTKTAP